MSLQVTLTQNSPVIVHTGTLNHSLGRMAHAAGIYVLLWAPETLGIVKARQLIMPLRKGLEELQARPETYKQYSPYGAGTYEQLVRFVQDYLAACAADPEALVASQS